MDQDDDELLSAATAAGALDALPEDEPSAAPTLRRIPSSEALEMANALLVPPAVTPTPRARAPHRLGAPASPGGAPRPPPLAGGAGDLSVALASSPPFVPGVGLATPGGALGTPTQGSSRGHPPPPRSDGRLGGSIVHLSRRLCGSFTSRRLDGTVATYYNGWYGFVRPDTAMLNDEGICREDLFLHPSDAADDYNPAIGDRVTFLRGVHKGRSKAVDVRLVEETQPASPNAGGSPPRARRGGAAPRSPASPVSEPRSPPPASPYGFAPAVSPARGTRFADGSPFRSGGASFDEPPRSPPPRGFDDDGFRDAPSPDASPESAGSGGFGDYTWPAGAPHGPLDPDSPKSQLTASAPAFSPRGRGAGGAATPTYAFAGRYPGW